MNKNEFKGLTTKWEAPALEDLPLEENMAFTLSPVRNHHIIGHGAESDIHHWTKEMLLDLHSKLKHSCIPELHTELSKTGRLHFHGKIRVKNVLGFYSQDLKELQDIGTYSIKEFFSTDEVDSVEDQDASNNSNIGQWDAYIGKQDNYFIPYYLKYPIAHPNSMEPNTYPFSVKF